MVRPVSLSDPAFEALRREKQDQESDSDVVLRLVEEARSARRDPMHFVRSRENRERVLSPTEHQELLGEAREKDWERARDRWEERSP